MSESEFEKTLSDHWPELPPKARERVVRIRDAILEENKQQNLTRIIGPMDFFLGHVVDCRAVLESSQVRYPAMDLGSGAGVPGLICGAIREDEWILAESEGRKAAFLSRVVQELDLKNIRVFSGRAEEFLAENRVESVVSRAVGSVEKIFSWLRPCSTWNNLILLKGPKWDEEWATFQASGNRTKLTLVEDTPYGASWGLNRRLVCLTRSTWNKRR